MLIDFIIFVCLGISARSAARIADGCFCARFASEKEKSCILFCRIGAFFSLAVNVKKELIEYLSWYNEKRIKVKLKGLPPLQFRNQSLKSA